MGVEYCMALLVDPLALVLVLVLALVLGPALAPREVVTDMPP